MPETDWTFFKPNMTNAFQTAPTFMAFLRQIAYTDIAGGWGLLPSDVDVMAHSLGNQVMWDAMRLNTFTSDGPLFNNAVGVEAAIWAEAFSGESVLTYSPPSDPITYTVDELKRMSWRSWFNQPGHDPRNSLTGKVFHSYNLEDSALVTWMRSSDYAARISKSHYNRLVNDPYRGPSNLAAVHALMSADDRTLNEFGGYTYTQLNRPIGSRANPMADFNFDAASAGWRPTEHSDFKDRDYVFVYDWYKRFLASPLSPDGPTAIAIGME